MGSPHMGFFSSPCPFPYGESPYGNGEGSFDAPLSHARVTDAPLSHERITQILEFWAIKRVPISIILWYPHFHMGSTMKQVPVSIWWSPYGNGDRQIPIWKRASPISIWGAWWHGSPFLYGDHHIEMGTRFQTGIVQSLTRFHMEFVSIWELS